MSLLYSVKTESEILFREELIELPCVPPHLDFVITVTEPGPEWTGRRGRITRVMIERDVPDWRERIFFISGQAAMANAIHSVLQEWGIPEDHQRFEIFPGY